MNGRRPSIPARILLAPIRFYQRFITPYTPATCRYYPTCSAYAATALREHGALRGSWLALRRLGRCHPWSEGGIDHVPPRRERKPARGSSTIGAACAITTPPPGRAVARPAHGPDRSRAVADRPPRSREHGRVNEACRVNHRCDAPLNPDRRSA